MNENEDKNINLNDSAFFSTPDSSLLVFSGEMEQQQQKAEREMFARTVIRAIQENDGLRREFLQAFGWQIVDIALDVPKPQLMVNGEWHEIVYIVKRKDKTE